LTNYNNLTYASSAIETYNIYKLEQFSNEKPKYWVFTPVQDLHCHLWHKVLHNKEIRTVHNQNLSYYTDAKKTDFNLVSQTLHLHTYPISIS